MNSHTTVVRKLAETDLTSKTVGEINELLKKQHTNANTTNYEDLRKKLRQIVIVVAFNNERIVGIGILCRVHCIAHSFGSIHNLVVAEGFNPVTLGMQITQELICDIYDLEYIIGGAWFQDATLNEIYKSLGFIQDPQHRYKLKLR